jgi:hypothetical protein
MTLQFTTSRVVLPLAAVLLFVGLPLFSGTGSEAFGASGTSSATCGQLTKTQIQPLLSVHVAKVKISRVSDGQQCVYSGSDGGGEAIDVVVISGREAKSSFTTEVKSLDGKVAVKGVGSQAYRERGDFQLDSIKGSTYCSVSVGSGASIPGVAALQSANGGSSDIPESDNAVIATALGTICNRIYKSGSTKVSLSALGSTTATTSGGGSSGAAPLGTTQSTTTSAEDPEKVTLVKVTDPASQTDPNNAPYAGMRWVGMQFTVVVNGPDSLAGAPFIIGSDGMTYGFNTAQNIGGFSGCTQVPADGQAKEGKPSTLCVGAMLPTNVQVAKVVFSGLQTTQTGKGVLYWSPS